MLRDGTADADSLRRPVDQGLGEVVLATQELTRPLQLGRPGFELFDAPFERAES